MCTRRAIPDGSNIAGGSAVTKRSLACTPRSLALIPQAVPRVHARESKRDTFASKSAGTNKTLLLTGASRGIGHATAKLFHEQGWRVITVSRAPFDLQCPWADGDIDHIQADLVDPRGITMLVEQIRKRLGGSGLNALVNNAAVSPKLAGGLRCGVEHTSYDTWLSVFNVNLFSAALLSQQLIDDLCAAGGNIVNITSIANSRVHPFAGTAYACSKAALAALTREQAFEFGRYGVRVNAIAPGEIDTSILSPGTEQIVATQIPLRRLGDPDEVANTILFLCSLEASFINGTEVQINGGQHV